MYHVRQLMRADLVQKFDRMYELTPTGKFRADKLHPHTLHKFEQPTVIILIACWDDAKGLLLFRRRTHPMIDMIGFPHVNVHLGKALIAGAEDEFSKLSGLSVSLRRRGDGYITFMRGNEPETFVCFHLLEGRNPKGEVRGVTEAGELAWYKQPRLSDPEYLPSMAELVHLLQGSAEQPFFVELQHTV